MSVEEKKKKTSNQPMTLSGFKSFLRANSHTEGSEIAVYMGVC